MSKSKMPGPLERRHLIERAIPEAQALRTAQVYLEADRAIEAVDFLRKAGALEELASLRAQAVAEGDGFLLRAGAEACGEVPTRAEWRELALAAAAAGKDRYAEEARRQADRGED